MKLIPRRCVITSTANASQSNDTRPCTLDHRVSRGAGVMFDPIAASSLSPEMRATLRESRCAYIKSIRSEQVAFLSAEAPVLAPGYRVFVVHAADGTPILLADSHEAAMAGAANQQIEIVSLN